MGQDRLDGKGSLGETTPADVLRGDRRTEIPAEAHGKSREHAVDHPHQIHRSFRCACRNNLKEIRFIGRVSLRYQGITYNNTGQVRQTL